MGTGAYNRRIMRASTRPLLRLVPILLSAVCGVAAAQAPATPSGELAREQTPGGAANQRAERIVTEDAGSRVEELRVGGQTQSITVQPKADVPAYEVKPVDGIRARPNNLQGERDGSSGGSRVWNIRNF